MKKALVIIGGGAAGLMAACAAARNNKSSSTRIIILEAGERVGKKILATGNGRCNLSNTNISPSFYHGLGCGIEPNDFTAPALSLFGFDEVVDYFSSIGLMCRTENERVYPYCNQASAVLDVLRNEAARLGVGELTNNKVEKIECRENGFRIYCTSNLTIKEYLASEVIITTGGCASAALGSNGSGFELLKQLGHKITELYPGLVQLKTNDPAIKGLKGIRFFGRISLLNTSNELITSSRGELMFTDYGLSGIPVMEVSSYIKSQQITAVIDFMPDYSLQKLEHYLKERSECLSSIEIEDFLTGLFNKKINRMLLRLSGITDMKLQTGSMRGSWQKILARIIKNLTLRIIGTNGFNNAQVTVGGAELSMFSPYTMESHVIKGLYAAGEVLDVNGDCGGYNLHWAWASGWTAGKNAVNRKEVRS